MRRRFALIINFLILDSASIAAAEPPPPEKPLILDDRAVTNEDRKDSTSEARFNELVRAGNRARFAGRLGIALDFYTQALGIHPDPLTSGRLGLVYFSIGMPEFDASAAMALYAAVLHSAGANKAERRQIWEAYDAVSHRVCRIVITTSDVDAEIAMSPEEDFVPSDGKSWTFINRGEQTIRARLKGHSDMSKIVRCVDHEEQAIHFDFTSTESPATPIPPPRVITKETTVVVREDAPAKATAGPTTPPPGDRHDREWRLFAGPAALFDIAPIPAFGVSAILGYQWQRVQRLDWLVEAGLLATWTDGAIERAPLRTSFFAAHGAVCARYHLFLGCPLLLLGNRRQSSTDPSIIKPGTESDFLFGVGLRLGIEKMVSRSIGLRAHGDAIVLSDKPSVNVQRYGSIWTGSGFLGTANIGIVWQF